MTVSTKYISVIVSSAVLLLTACAGSKKVSITQSKEEVVTIINKVNN